MAIGFSPPYFVDERRLSRTAGLVQIRDFARDQRVETLLTALELVQSRLKAAKAEFYDVVTSEFGLNYFGRTSHASQLEVPTATRFQKTLARRLAVAGLAVKELHNDPNFGRTKLAKVFYLADKRAGLQLEADYVREAAGPLDQRALYNKRIGVEAMAEQHQVFRPKRRGKMVRYERLAHPELIDAFARGHLGEKTDDVMRVVDACRTLSTDQVEIVATLYACWNDLLIRQDRADENTIIKEFLVSWHPKKTRFDRGRLRKALKWMNAHDLVPVGSGSLTSSKRLN